MTPALSPLKASHSGTRGSFELTRRHAFASLVGIVITALVLAALYHNLSIRTIIELGERNNVTVATLALNAVIPELDEGPPLSEPWERAVLAGASYRETRTEAGRSRYEASWGL